MPVLSHPRVQKAFPDVRREPVFQRVPEARPLVLTLGTAAKSLAVSSLHPPFRF